MGMGGSSSHFFLGMLNPSTEPRGNDWFPARDETLNHQWAATEERDLGVGQSQAKTHQWDMAVKKASLSCEDREVGVPLGKAQASPPLGCCVQLWAPAVREEELKLDPVQKNGEHLMRGKRDSLAFWPSREKAERGAQC